MTSHNLPSDSPEDVEQSVASTNRRKKPPKRRVVKKERRESMLIVTAASQADIYLWAVSMALTLTIVCGSIILGILYGK